MKKLLLYAFAAIVALASCTKDPDGPRKIGEQVTYGFSVSSDDAMSFYNDAQARHDMEAGGIKNVDPSQFFIRYVIDLYRTDGVTFAYRYERLVDFTAGSGAKFNLRVPTDRYKLAVWADFVPKEGLQASPVGGLDEALDPDDLTANDFWYNTNFDGNGIRNVSIRPDMFNAKGIAVSKGGGRMSRDAYCGTMSFDLISGKQEGRLNLKRVLGRVAVYGRNMDADRLAAASYSVPDSIVVTYPAGTYYANYNVMTGTASATEALSSDLVYSNSLTAEDNPVEANGKLGNETFPDLQLLTFDYLFPTVDGNKTSFSIKYFEEGAEIMGIGTSVPDRTIASNKQQRLVADVYDDDHQFVAVAKDADGKVIAAGADKMLDAKTALSEAIAVTPAGGTVKLYAGEFKSTGLTIDKSISIEGIEGKSVIYGENLVAQTTSVGSYYGQYPILFIKGPDTKATPMNVAIKDVSFTIKNTPYPNGFDGLTIDGHAGLTIENSVFDGIGNTNPAYQSTGNQYGRCISVMGGGTLTVDKCTFKKFNKNAVDVFEGGSAALSNCTVTGDNYNAQTVYNNTAGTAEEKDLAAYGGSPIQNGFVFRTGTSGSVTGCTFSNIKFGLDKGLRRAKNDQSRAVYLYEPGTTTSVAGENDETNTYTNCELNWSSWTYAPPSSDASLSWIKVNGVNVTGFSGTQLTYNVNVASDVASAIVTADKTDFYADMTISPAVSTPLEVGVPVAFKINTKSEDGNTELEYTVTVTRAASTDATLSSLKLNGATVPNFSAAVHTYNITVPNDKTTAAVTATATYAKASLVIDPADEQQLAVGTMVPFKVTVTAEDGVTKIEYLVNVTRAASTDATLSDLQLNGATVTGFNSAVYTYNISVENAQTTAIVTATAKNAQATAVVSPVAEQALTVGVMVPFTVTVTAEDGTTTHTYTVNVTRKASSNTRWSGFSLNGLPAVGFDANVNTYDVDVPNSTATAKITATAEDPNASVAVTPSAATDLVPGVAKAFSVVVTAQDGTTFTYTVNVTRTLSDNSKLGSLQVNGAALNIVDGQAAYDFTVSNLTETATVTATAADAAAGASVTVSPSIATALEAGVPQVFTVTVTAANHSTSNYTVNVTREAVVVQP